MQSKSELKVALKTAEQSRDDAKAEVATLKITVENLEGQLADAQVKLLAGEVPEPADAPPEWAPPDGNH